MKTRDLRDEITPTTKANEILMQAIVDKRFYLIVEGITDFRLFNQFLSVDDWEVEFLNGKVNVAQCMKELTQADFNRASAVLDSDPLDPCTADGEVFYSALADLDADLFAINGIIDRIIRANSRVRDQIILAQTGRTSWRDLVMHLVGPWTVARRHLADADRGVGMKDFPIHALGDSERIALKTSELSKMLHQKTSGYLTPDDLARIIREAEDDDLEPLHNGHHIAGVVAWIVSEVLAGTKMRPETIEDFARTIVTAEELKTLSVISNLTGWAHIRGKCIWAASICDHSNGTSSPPDSACVTEN